MWAVKISFDGAKKNVLARYAKENNIRILIFPLSWTYEKTGIIVNVSGVIYGNSKNKKRFIKAWKQQSKNRLLDIEFNGDFFLGIVREHPDAKTVYNKNIIFTKPWLIDENGFQIIIVNAFKKKYLEKFINIMDKFHKIEINYIKKEKIKDISFKAHAPDLTDKQKQAMEIAIRKGYYNYPRKTSIKQLAEISKLGFTTFHSHLRKAEQKLMPFFFKQ